MDTLIIIGLILAFILVILSIIYFCFRKRGRDNSSNKNRFKNTPWAIENLQKNFHKKKKLDKIDTPIFYINLDRSSDRRAVMEKQLKAVSSNYQRVSAVDGKKMDNKIVDQVDDITFQNDYLNMSFGEIGCTLSHIKAIRMAYDKGYNKALIIEDDLLFYLYPFWENSLEDIANKAPDDWGVIQLYAIKEECNSEEERFIKYHNANDCCGTAAYFVNRKGMYDILNRSSFLTGDNIVINNNIKNSYGQADYYIYESTNTYVYTKPIFLVGDEFLPSTIHRDHESMHKHSVNRKLDMYSRKKPFFSDITTIITTAPQPSIPSPKLLVKTLKSLNLVPLFMNSPIIIGFDGCEVNNKKLDPKCTSVFNCSIYDEYKKNVKKEVLKIIPYVKFVELEERGCLSSLLNKCMENVDTEFVNVMQQDLPIIKSFNAQKIIDIMKENNDMDMVRYVRDTNNFHENWTKKRCSKIFEPKTIMRNNTIFTQCSQWSDNNHIAKIDHYKNIVWSNTQPYSFMEHQLVCYPINNKYDKIWYLGEKMDGYYIKDIDGRNTK